MKNKIFWLIMLILILTVSCGEKNNTSGKDGSKEIVLRFLWWEVNHVIKQLLML